ncbi:hypothetical protein [Yinghuangia seranimata]|uniref:hypothetical protein n=1 Tax=Yinghuangia seranimata TaxID=408067 RepID=UPI00248B50B0|nr:hypothetical protein [Yinghuangia seranimata]MDI2125032.1 hypothetical protein [Yinghuangia seranimata]
MVVNSVAVPADGSALKVGVGATPGARLDVAAAKPSIAAAAGVDVVVAPREPLKAASRYADSAPYYSGSFLNSEVAWCTTGIPVMDSAGKNYMVTAYHCGKTGVRFRNGDDASVGWSVNHNSYWDASLIDTPSARWEYDGPKGGSYQRFKLTSTAYSYNGDYVHQNGYTSGVVGGIVVDDQDVEYHVVGSSYGTYTVRGVSGHQVNGGCSVQGGDSGGLVFRYVNEEAREVRGVVSAGDCSEILWTEARDIYKAFGVQLTTRE